MHTQEIEVLSAQGGSWLDRGRLLLPNLLAIVGVAGIAVYAIARSFYSGFYGPLGVTPEEVGLDYVEILQLSYAGLLVGVAILVVVVILSALLFTVYLLAYLATMK